MVFLDFNHYYAMGAEHHVYLITMLQEVFGSKLCSNCAVESITLDYLWQKKYQVRSGRIDESGHTTILKYFKTNIFPFQTDLLVY